jgi:hypothetical protein
VDYGARGEQGSMVNLLNKGDNSVAAASVRTGVARLHRLGRRPKIGPNTVGRLRLQLGHWQPLDEMVEHVRDTQLHVWGGVAAKKRCPQIRR